MSGLNKVMIIGNLGNDPELKYLPNGTAICSFSAATSETWTDKTTGDRQERTEWHRITAFGKTAENCGKYLAKGRQVYVEGKLQTSSYEKDGQTHYTTKIIADVIQFLGQQSNQGAPGGQGSYQPQQKQQGGYSPGQSSGPAQVPPEEDIPF